MKTKRRRKTKPEAASESIVLRDATYLADAWTTEKTGAMIRTQIYLSPAEHRFLQAESARRGKPMAAIIRSYIDEKMNLPEEAWTQNSLLTPPADPDFVGPEDGVINHDHYIYGSPRRHVKKQGRWVPAPPLPEDYYTNEDSRRAYDQSTGAKE